MSERRVVVNKNEGAGKTVYNYYTSEGLVVYKKTINNLVFKDSFWKGFKSLVNIAGSFDEISIRRPNNDSKRMREDWERVGQSLMDGMISMCK